MAAAPVGDAEGGGARGEHGGPGGPARAGALLGRLGPHATDRRAGQDSPGPVLQDAGGIERGWAGKSRRRGVWGGTEPPASAWGSFPGEHGWLGVLFQVWACSSLKLPAPLLWASLAGSTAAFPERPSTRTPSWLQGFQVLVESDWLDFGHKFGDRCGHQENAEDQNEQCPVFLQWLDSVHQLLKQFPCLF